MNIGVVIFARMDSSRLPGKMLMDIGGRTLLQNVIERAKQIKGASKIVVATSDRESDDQICQQANDSGIDFFRGSLEDVAGRALNCAEQYKFDYIARICGDRPFFDPVIYSNLIMKCSERMLDLATNAIDKTYPPGLTAEVVKIATLRQNYSAFDSKDKEHITQYLYNNETLFVIENIVSSKPEYRNISLVVDTEKDLEKIRWVVKKMQKDPVYAPMDEILKLTKEWMQEHCSGWI